MANRQSLFLIICLLIHLWQHTLIMNFSQLGLQPNLSCALNKLKAVLVLSLK